MPRIIRYLAPSLGDAVHLGDALARCNRTLGSQRPFAGDAWPAVDVPDTLLWRVRSLAGDGGCFLEADESGCAHWDLALARALSAAADGFVLALAADPEAGRRGEAVLFAGRTIEARSWGDPSGDVRLGAPDDADGAPDPVTLYERRFGWLCGDSWRLLEGPVVAAGDWSVGPAHTTFDHRSESGFSLVLLGDLDPAWESLDLARLAPGWRYRVRRTSALRSPYVELRRDGPLDEALVIELSGRLRCGAAGVEVPGGGREYEWVEAYRGAASDRGRSVGAQAFILTLASVGDLVGERPGQLFGRGCEGWIAAE